MGVHEMNGETWKVITPHGVFIHTGDESFLVISPPILPTPDRASHLHGFCMLKGQENEDWMALESMDRFTGHWERRAHLVN